jgi:hypothetical protein
MRSLQWYTLVVGMLAAAGCGSEDTTEPPPPAPPITVKPSFVTVTIGESTKLLASAPHEAGATMQPTEVVWRSADGAIASISESGVVQGLHAGRTRVSASWRGKQAFSIVTVIDTRSSGKRPVCDVVLADRISRIPKNGPCK